MTESIKEMTFENALNDANDCIKVDDKFAKGYLRKGTALFKMGKKDWCWFMVSIKIILQHILPAP